MEPFINVKIEDTTTGVDSTNTWVPRGDDVRFDIETNLYTMTQRLGTAGVPITLKVRNPVGEVFTALVNSAGASTSIIDLMVSSSQYYTGSIWNTSNALYPGGSYAVWAECNANLMKDNYNDAGKTVSQQYTLLNQDRNPLITAKTVTKTLKPTTTKTTIPTATPTQSPTPTVTVSPLPVVSTLSPVSTAAATTPPVTLPSDTTTVLSAPTPSAIYAPGWGVVVCSLGVLIVCWLFRRKR